MSPFSKYFFYIQCFPSFTPLVCVDDRTTVLRSIRLKVLAEIRRVLSSMPCPQEMEFIFDEENFYLHKISSDENRLGQLHFVFQQTCIILYSCSSL